MIFSPLDEPQRLADPLAALRAQVAGVRRSDRRCLAFGIDAIDHRLEGHGLDGAGLHEIAAASTRLSDDAAATLFAAGIAARFSALDGRTILWALTRFDLYAPGLEQVGVAPGRIVYAQGRADKDVLAFAEDGLRAGVLACVIAEVKAADITATRRLQLAACDGETPMLLFRRHRTRDQCPLGQPSSAMTRWRIGAAPSERLPYPGVGRACWSVALLRQRGGNPFDLIVEACDDTGRLALPAAIADRATAQDRAAIRAA